MRPGSGNLTLLQRKHLAGNGDYLLGNEMLPKKGNMFAAVVGGGFLVHTKDKYGKSRQAIAQLSHKRRTAEALRMVARDDKVELAGKGGLLHNAESLGSIGGTKHFAEFAPQERHGEMCLEGVVIY
jgi:hypothetical protein